MKQNRLHQDAPPCNKPELRQLTAKQLLAAQMVAVGGTDDTIAVTHGLNRSTVYRWRIFSPLFQAEVNRHRAVLNAKIGDKLRDSVFSAVDTVAQLMTSSEDEGIKLKAASLLLGLVPLSIHVGPTDPREIVRPLADQRNFDTPRECDRVIHAMDGTKPINELIRTMLIELEQMANDTAHDSEEGNNSDATSEHPLLQAEHPARGG